MYFPTFTHGWSLNTLAKDLGAEIIGDSEKILLGVNSLDTPLNTDLVFISSTNATKVLKLISDKLAGAFLVHSSLKKILPSDRNFILSDNPQASFIKLIPRFYSKQTLPPGISPKADISVSATIGEGCYIAAFCVIGDNCIIGRNVTIYPNVVLYPNVKIGNDVTIHAGVIIRENCIIGDGCVLQNGAVIGGDGFGYIPDPKIGLATVPQIGDVVLGARVDIGVNSAIDRAAIGSTTIGDGTKVDNLVQIGHNGKIGKNCIICGTVGIAGSVELGDQVVLGGGSGVADHIKITSGVRVGGYSGVTSDLDVQGDYMGFPAIKATQWRRQMVSLRKSTQK